MSFSALGRTPASPRPPPAPRLPQYAPPSRSPGARSLLHWLDRLFLGIPNEREPGALAVLVFFARQLALAVVAILIVLIAWLDAPKGDGSADVSLTARTFAKRSPGS